MVYYIWIRSLDILLFIRVVIMNISLDEPVRRIFVLAGMMFVVSTSRPNSDDCCYKSKEELEEELTLSSKSTMHYGVSKRQESTGIVSFSLI